MDSYHDYKFSWDYDMYRADKKLKALVADISKRLHIKLLPKVKVFTHFNVGFIKNVMEHPMGVYVNGTSDYPFIGLNVPVIKRTCKKFNCAIEVGIETTILHELGHAIQEYYGLEFDEDDAEDFAQDYFDYGIVNNFWK